MKEELVKINAKVVHVVYHNEDNFYTVLRLKLNDENEKSLTATGFIQNIEPDILYNFYGQYVEHAKYGMQFNIQSYEKPLPSEREGIIRYLSGIQFPGVGQKTAKKIVEYLGDDCLSMIRNDLSVLDELNLSQKIIDSIRDGLAQEDSSMEELIQFLNVHGIGIRNIIRLNKAYGKEALEKLKENPYRVIEECDGFGFLTADKIAKSIGVEDDDPRRMYAYLISLCMNMCMKTGDSFVKTEALQEQYEKAGFTSFEELLQKALFNRQLVKEDNRIYPITQYQSEEGISDFLVHFPYYEIQKVDKELLSNYLEELQQDFAITYDETQKEAIFDFFDHPFSIITGGPGTGKTTVVKAIVTLFKMLYPTSEIICSAPTGRASKRLSELTDCASKTIHSLLEWDLETNTFGKNEKEPVLADLLIIDEFSMVDNWLFYNLLLASKRIKKICIIGDENQLPSVSPGCVLRELIESQLFPVIRLNHIYRQKDGSDVIQLAHDIQTSIPNFDDYHDDIAFFECSAEDIKNKIVFIVKDALDKNYSLSDIQVLSPIYSGPVGIDILNKTLQETFNPKDTFKREIKTGYMTFREGDKILQLKNQPDDDVYNGDIGTLVEIESSEENENGKTTLYVQFDETFVSYTLDNISNITLAYCISIHKSQGSEYPIVIMPIVNSHYHMLQRKLIYTGVTRARQSLILLGSKNAFIKGIETEERHERESSLKEKLIEKGKNKKIFL
ncbi:MAG: ATP-dependent RecD-like DNA helicase [Erysipelotrichaceae bacterium]|nr:ATP-dependent RecD-like DNA helicase [Erysipelotrichaceae bacterium]